MKKWEYTIKGVARIKDEPFSEHIFLTNRYLDIQGGKGWELVAVNDGIAYFKREAQEELSEEAKQLKRELSRQK